jgi:beta-galactosidase
MNKPGFKVIKPLFKTLKVLFLLILPALLYTCSSNSHSVRKTESFNKNWNFFLGDITNGQDINFKDSDWRDLNVPHDWSIEGSFSKDHPATPGGGALPGGIGWYRKSFHMPETDKDKLVFIEFDGIYKDSEVWINGNYLGKRPNGYISFRYELTNFLQFGDAENVLAVKVDNSKQPNSRWYSGSGIYRNVRLVATDKIYVDHWGTFITTPKVSKTSAVINIETRIKNTTLTTENITVVTQILDLQSSEVAKTDSAVNISNESDLTLNQKLTVKNPNLWSVENPALYKAITLIKNKEHVLDRYETTFGIRYFSFNANKGFILNGEPVKIKGVCNHHDLGSLGAAINKRALERQLEILKGMGCNGIRTSHNPPAPELLELCDKMGFIVMDEAFDVWQKKKVDFDYHQDFDQWHKRDLEDLILRDRNHPSIFMWSIGNEVIEQWDQKDPAGIELTRKLTAIVKGLDSTRPVTAGCNGTYPENPLFKADVLDIIGFNYAYEKYKDIPQNFPGKPFIATETESSLHTRGHYDMPSDSIRRWPPKWDLPLLDGNADHTCSSYDNCTAPWGSTHEETWRVVKKYDFISGMYTWTGFDYLGEPTPYSWPARSSYFGIIDLAGFPKDAYYLYKSEWTNESVLHIFPHWNWEKGQAIDVWAYTNIGEVELFLNGVSQGIKSRNDTIMHIVWPLIFEPGEIKAIARKNGKEVLSKVIKTAGKAYQIELTADRTDIKADGEDLSFITVRILDEQGNFVPGADNLVNFKISGNGQIAGVDNGHQASQEPFKADYRKAFNGMCLVIIRSNETPGLVKLEATAEGLLTSAIEINTK